MPKTQAQLTDSAHMKYAIRRTGSSDFLSGFADNGEPKWVEGWGNAKMLQWPSREQAALHLHLVFKDGLHAMIEEVEETNW